MLVQKPALRLYFLPFFQRNVFSFGGFFKVRMGERSVRIREVKRSNPSMLHLSSWMTTLPMMLIGMTGILLVIGLLHRRRRRCFCRIHPLASCRVVWKYSLGVMPYSFLKARKKWL